jgi:uncharacterized protein YndB with AHSA1/START domain
MTEGIRREMLIPQPREQVWRALTDSATLAEWMYPNDFEPRVGHYFTFRVPPNPKVGFEGLVVRCEVLECEPPRENSGGRLAFSWSAGGPVVDTRVSFLLEPDGDGTRLVFEHSGFDLSHPFGNQAFKGAEFGWAKMLKQLSGVVAGLAGRQLPDIWQMHIDDFNGRTTVDDPAMLVARLASVRKGPYGAFVLSHSDKGASLWVHINENVAYLHFFADNSGNHAGFQPADMAPPDCEEDVHFIQTDGGEGGAFDMCCGALVSVGVAYEAASEFFASPVRPSCVTWTEL